MGPAMPHGVKDDQVAMQVVRHIRTLIETGALKGGERLAPEREFAKELKISRASLRAGVGYLAAIGVLQVRHGVGTFVVEKPLALHPTGLDVMSSKQGFTPRHSFEARHIIEPGVAALAAERRTEAHLEALGGQLVDMEATVEDPVNYLIHDISFHRILGEASGNPILSALIERMSASLYDARREDIVFSRDIPKSVRAHRLIYDAVRGRQAAEARHCMGQHLREAEEGLRQDIERRLKEEKSAAATADKSA